MPKGRFIALQAGLAAVYVVAAKAGLSLAFVHPSATAVWAPTGLAVASLLILGRRAWPAVFVGAFIANATTAGSVITALGISVGNTLEAVIGAAFVAGFASGVRAFERAASVFAFTGLALAFTTVSATFGVTSLCVTGYAHWDAFGPIWWTWWLGDVAGALLVTPAILLWLVPTGIPWTLRHSIEGIAFVAALVAVGAVVFGGLLPMDGSDYPLEFLCLPLLVWAGFRFSPRDSATALILLAAVAIRGTLGGLGPFARGSRNESLLLLQAFLSVAAVMTLALAAVVAERRRAGAELERLAVTDPLTGLANYRRLMATLEGEIERSRRSDRPFSMLLLDVDGLKKINDRYGHLVGSRALCRVAEALGRSCRAIDTAARFGGDEFAVILPETAEVTAQHVAQRLAAELSADREEPRVTVSVGVAEFPRDAATAETLLDGADRHMYETKALRSGQTSARGR
jgi:diguanylate cyclase (GGDEF)-like protein